MTQHWAKVALLIYERYTDVGDLIKWPRDFQLLPIAPVQK